MSASMAVPAGIVPSKEIYFPDGNIVLVASSTAFKVHKCQLARHSDMFRDLFQVVSDPQSTDITCDEFYDGVPKIHIHDHPDDVERFLKALYDGLYLFPSSASFASMSSTFRLSSKYLVPRLQALCITRITSDWPSTLHGWDQREKAATDPRGKYNPREFTPYPVQVIQLVMNMGCEAFNVTFPSRQDDAFSSGLPEDTGLRAICSALYDLSRYGPSRILTSIASSSQDNACNVPSSPPSPILIHALRGREEAQKYIASFIANELHGREPSTHCVYRVSGARATPYHYALSPQACQESFYFITLNLLRSIGGIACGRDADPLFTLVQAVEMMERRDFTAGPGQTRTCSLKICVECKADFKQCAEKAREEVWELLPSWFGLDEFGLKR